MRNWINVARALNEAREIPATRISVGGPVYLVVTRSKLNALLERLGSLRAELFDRELDVWDASLATHRAYEDAFGMEGFRLMISTGSIEINAHDYESEDPIEEFKAIPVIQKLFPDIDEWSIGVNEI